VWSGLLVMMYFVVYIKSRRKFKDRRIQQVNKDFRNRVAKTLDGL
jgi:hypothetical protein